MTELEKYKAAMSVALQTLEVCTNRMESKSFNDAVRKDIAAINAILNPPPAVETVEVVRWECSHCGGVRKQQPTLDDHYDCCQAEKKVFTKLQGTLTREVQKVERSATAVGVSIADSHEGTAIWPHSSPLEGDADWGSIVGKTVDVTFTWEE